MPNCMGMGNSTPEASTAHGHGSLCSDYWLRPFGWLTLDSVDVQVQCSLYPLAPR